MYVWYPPILKRKVHDSWLLQIYAKHRQSLSRRLFLAKLASQGAVSPRGPCYLWVLDLSWCMIDTDYCSKIRSEWWETRSGMERRLEFTDGTMKTSPFRTCLTTLHVTSFRDPKLTWPKLCGNYAVVSQKSNIFWFHYPVADFQISGQSSRMRKWKCTKSCGVSVSPAATWVSSCFFTFFYIFLYMTYFAFLPCPWVLQVSSILLRSCWFALVQAAQVFLLLTAITIPWGLWSGDPSHPSHPSQGPLGPLG